MGQEDEERGRRLVPSSIAELLQRCKTQRFRELIVSLRKEHTHTKGHRMYVCELDAPTGRLTVANKVTLLARPGDGGRGK